MLAAAVGGVPTRVGAGKIDPDIALVFVPQQTVAGAEVSVTPEMTERGVALRLVDGRSGTDATSIGTRTDDDDRPHELRAANDVMGFLLGTLEQLARQWGVRVGGDSDRTLELNVLAFQVRETNQAVGATFSAETRMAVTLLDADGGRLWSGPATGDASRYGRGGSDANCNEVLSDSLLEAFADALSQPSLQAAWAGTRGGGATVVSPSTPATGDVLTTPEQLRDDLRALLDQGFEVSTLLEYVAGRRLARPLAAAELTRWKEAAIPEEVIRAALARPVG